MQREQVISRVRTDGSNMTGDIPSMGGTDIGGWLYDTVAGVNEGGAVVECGSWLGASIAPVAQALADSDSDVEIHCYDRWQASASEVRKAREQGVTIDEGQDLLPLFLDFVGDIYEPIITHKTDALDAEWGGGDIELYIDDMNKKPRQFKHAMETFGPHWIPGETVVVLMDYQFYKDRDSTIERRRDQCQRDFIEAHPSAFESIIDFEGLSGVAFRYEKPIDWEAPILQTWYQRLYAQSRYTRAATRGLRRLLP